MNEEYEMEVLREIWNNKDGYVIEVGPDRDGTDWVEVRIKQTDGKITERIMIDPKCSEMVGKAIIDCGKELLNKK